jgi:hypothetical protein
VFLVKVDAVFKGSKADVSPLKLAFACPSSISADPPLRAVSTVGGIPIYLRRAGDRWRLRERNEQPRSFVTFDFSGFTDSFIGGVPVSSPVQAPETGPISPIWVSPR